MNITVLLISRSSLAAHVQPSGRLVFRWSHSPFPFSPLINFSLRDIYKSNVLPKSNLRCSIVRVHPWINRRFYCSSPSKVNCTVASYHAHDGPTYLRFHFIFIFRARTPCRLVHKIPRDMVCQCLERRRLTSTLNWIYSRQHSQLPPCTPGIVCTAADACCELRFGGDEGVWKSSSRTQSSLALGAPAVALRCKIKGYGRDKIVRSKLNAPV
jgi:hypothetical protein